MSIISFVNKNYLVLSLFIMLAEIVIKNKNSSRKCILGVGILNDHVTPPILLGQMYQALHASKRQNILWHWRRRTLSYSPYG